MTYMLTPVVMTLKGMIMGKRRRKLERLRETRTARSSLSNAGLGKLELSSQSNEDNF
jgi:hypothetical protein